MLLQIRQALKVRRGMQINYWKIKLMALIALLFLFLNISDLYLFNHLIRSVRGVYLLVAVLVTLMGIIIGWVQISDKVKVIQKKLEFHQDNGYLWILLLVIVTYFSLPFVFKAQSFLLRNMLELFVSGLILGRFTYCHQRIRQSKLVGVAQYK